MPVLTQVEAMALWLPRIESEGIDYEKFTKVEARQGVVGEVIESITKSGKQTQNKVVSEEDLVLCNIETESKEEYILAKDKVLKRYRLLGPGSREGWDLYQATGEFRGIVYNGEDTSFIAPWGEEMVLKNGDLIGTPLPNKGEVYRIGRPEFDQTYRKKAQQQFYKGK